MAAGGPAPPRSFAARALPWLAGLALGAVTVAVADRTLLAPAPPAPARLVSLTHSGKDFTPTASPDGKTIAFTSTRDGRSRIWVKQLATGEEVAITSGPSDSLPVFSPDGSSLLFLRGASQSFGIYRVATIGGEPRRITDGAASSAAWSPDGRSVAFTRSATASGLPDIVVVTSADGGGERELARVTDVTLVSLRWSPDGRSIGAWAQLRTNFAALQSIVEFDAATGERRTIYQPGGGTLIYGWAWSGADAIVVAESVTQSGRGGSRLLRIPRAGGAPMPLLSLRQPASGLDILGDGRLVVDQVASTQNLAEWPLGNDGEVGGGREPRRWLTRGASVDRQPVYSPDGRKVVFNSDRGGNLDIWELDLASAAVRPLTVAPADDWDPALAADGRQLLWSSNRSGNYEIWIAAADGSGARQLTADGVDAENPTATPDGQWVVYVSANPAHNGVWRIRADGRDAARLVDGTHAVAELSPDGRWVAFSDLDRARLTVAALTDGARIAEIELPTIPFNALQLGRSRWIPGSSIVVWLDFDTTASVARIVAQEIALGRDTRATRRTLWTGTPDEIPESFAVSPDGAHLLVSVLQPRSELLLVEGLPGVGR